MEYKNYLEIKPLTTEETLNHEAKNYNPTTWEQIVKRYLSKQKDVEFFERLNSPNNYAELYVKYTISEGITFFGRLSYSGSMSNGNFAMCQIENGYLKKTPHYINTDHLTREMLSFMSKNYNSIFTKI